MERKWKLLYLGLTLDLELQRFRRSLPQATELRIFFMKALMAVRPRHIRFRGFRGLGVQGLGFGTKKVAACMVAMRVRAGQAY